MPVSSWSIPDSDTFRRVFEKINPSELSSCLINRLSVKRGRRETIAIDGKTICGSENDKHRAYYVISAFVAETQLTFGEITVEEKSDEIIAVPELPELTDVEGYIVTADAMSCQKKIVKKIIEKGADYTIGIKQNQPALYQDTKDYFDSFTKDIPVKITLDKGHGRIEKTRIQTFSRYRLAESENRTVRLESAWNGKINRNRKVGNPCFYKVFHYFFN